MIETKYLAALVQGWLNGNSLGKQFVVYADHGEVVEACRCKMEYVTNCVLQETSQVLLPIKDLTLETISVDLGVFVDKDITGGEIVNNNIQSQNLLDIKGILCDTISAYNGKTSQTTINDKNFTMTVTFGSLIDGVETGIGDIDDGMWLNLSINFVFFEGGVSSSDCHVYVNGEDIFFSKGVISRVKTADNSQPIGVDGSKAYVLTSGRSIDLVVPALNTDFGKATMNDVLGNETNKLCWVYVDTPLGAKSYNMIFGNTSANMENGLNVGYNVSFAEGNMNICSYADDYFEDWTSFNLTETTTISCPSGKHLAIYFTKNTNETEAVNNQTILVYSANKTIQATINDNVTGYYREF